MNTICPKCRNRDNLLMYEEREYVETLTHVHVFDEDSQDWEVEDVYDGDPVPLENGDYRQWYECKKCGFNSGELK